MVALIPVAVVFFRDRKARTRWLRAALHKGAKLWLGFHELLGVLDVQIEDHREPGLRSNEDASTPVLVIANHPSLIDVLLITATLPNLCCVLKGALHYNPLFTTLIRYLDYLPNSDPERMLAEGNERLLAGEQLLIFPEGTRTEPGKPLQFRMGAAELAARSGACVLPVTIHTNSPYLSKGVPWYQWPTDRLCYRLELGPLLQSTSASSAAAAGSTLSSADDKKSRRRARRAINQVWRNHFAQRLAAHHVGN